MFNNEWLKIDNANLIMGSIDECLNSFRNIVIVQAWIVLQQKCVERWEIENLILKWKQLLSLTLNKQIRRIRLTIIG